MVDTLPKSCYKEQWMVGVAEEDLQIATTPGRVGIRLVDVSRYLNHVGYKFVPCICTCLASAFVGVPVCSLNETIQNVDISS